MVNWVRKSISAFNERGGFFMFLRAQCSSQMASMIDFIATILVVQCFAVYYVYASFIGSVCGGVFNCIINYKWTFRASDCKVKYVALKYTSVWIGSIALNTYGTYAMTESLRAIPWVRNTLSLYFSDFFIVPKIIVSLLVGFFWNYQLQRVFVYRNKNLKRYFTKNNHTNILKDETTERLDTTNDL
jgi:putative flippase GtrA